MRGVVVKYDQSAGRGFARVEGLETDVMFNNHGHVKKKGTTGDLYQRIDITSVPEGAGVDLIVVVQSDRGYHSPVWRSRAEIPADPTSLEEIQDLLEPATLKFYNDERGYGFLIVADGTELFAHASNFRIIENGGVLRRSADGEVTKAALGENPDLLCVRGPGKKPGAEAAIFWLVRPA